MAGIFEKRAVGAALGQPLYEAAGLGWLHQGGAKTPTVLEASASRIVTERILETGPTAEGARALGTMLAHMHAAGAQCYGTAPSDYSGRGWMGAAPLELVGPDSPHTGRSWGAFYSELRIRPYLSNVFSERERLEIHALCEALESGALDHAEPELVTRNGHAASRIHGDLWSGNVLWGARGPVLIDPAAQGGHAEEDLATLRTFGTPYLAQVIEAYQEVSPLEHGWESRTDLHQMHILMVHCYLFGRSYVPRTMEAVRKSLNLL